MQEDCYENCRCSSLSMWCAHLSHGTEFRCVRLIEDPDIECGSSGNIYLCEKCDKEVISDKRKLWEVDFQLVCDDCFKERLVLLTILATHDCRKHGESE